MQSIRANLYQLAQQLLIPQELIIIADICNIIKRLFGAICREQYINETIEAQLIFTESCTIYVEAPTARIFKMIFLDDEIYDLLQRVARANHCKYHDPHIYINKLNCRDFNILVSPCDNCATIELIEECEYNDDFVIKYERTQALFRVIYDYSLIMRAEVPSGREIFGQNIKLF